MNRRLIRNGVILAFLGALSGFAPMIVRNPRMGLAAHLGAIMNGLLLIGLGASWAEVRLTASRARLAIALLLWAAYGNWAVTLASSITGAKEFAPLAGAGFGASAIIENATFVLIGTVALTLLAGLGIVLSGLFTDE